VIDPPKERAAKNCLLNHARRSARRPKETGGNAMLSFLGCTAQGIAVANGVTTVALLEVLVEKKILTCADAREIIDRGITCLEPRINVGTVREAVELMRERMLPLFGEEKAGT
jgi:hypothetical protein